VIIRFSARLRWDTRCRLPASGKITRNRFHALREDHERGKQRADLLCVVLQPFEVQPRHSTKDMALFERAHHRRWRITPSYCLVDHPPVNIFPWIAVLGQLLRQLPVSIAAG
jgi:hypothetical protein